MSTHEEQEEVHQVHRWEHANAAARTGETVVSGDLGKISWQTDTDVFYILTDTGPTWDVFGSGDTGPQGDTGVAGAQGDTGTAGAKGDTGDQGDTGDGDTGVQGDTGDSGDTGIQGDTGPGVGDTGTQGDTGVSVAGEIFLPATSGWPSTTNGCADATKLEYTTNDIDLYSLDFNQTSIEYAQWSVWMPTDWNAGTVTFQAVWTAVAGTLTNTFEFNLQGRSYANDDPIDAAWGASIEVSDALIALDDIHYSAVSGAVTLAGTPAGGEFIQLRGWRDAPNDTLDADAKLLGIKVFFTRT